MGTKAHRLIFIPT